MSDPGKSDRPVPEPPEISEEKIAGLLRLTGRRPPVPAERTHRVKAAVRARWLAEVGERSRRRTFRTVAALATAAALVVLVGWGRRLLEVPPAAVTVGRVDAVSGPASIRTISGRAAPPADLRRGDEVASGSALETGAGGRLAFRLSSGGSLRLDVDSRVEVLSDRTLALTSGAVYVDSGRPDAPDDATARSIEIRTPAGNIREIGTQFEVRMIDAALRVRVREGLVSVDRPGGGLQVPSGRELRVEGNGSTSSREVLVHGEEWSWIAAITPMMEIEGRSLREFLDWMARERGLALRFGDGGVAAAVPTIRLNGSIAGMTLDQALESVLLTCRMRHRVEADLLVVEALDDPPGSS
jgi:ferric-dicitrate binding protein FerR (iron transport regulator)